jgi:hypothetical protein
VLADSGWICAKTGQGIAVATNATAKQKKQRQSARFEGKTGVGTSLMRSFLKHSQTSRQRGDD